MCHVQVIGPGGLLQHKTRVLVTHGVSFLPLVDEIVVMKDGRISEQGSYLELVARKGAFSEFLLQHMGPSQEEGVRAQPEQGMRGRLGGRKSSIGEPGGREAQEQGERANTGGKIEGRLIHSEGMQTGGVNGRVFR